MLYEDRQYKISRDRLIWLLKIEHEYYENDPHNVGPKIPFNAEVALKKYEELPSNDKKIVKVTYCKSSSDYDDEDK